MRNIRTCNYTKNACASYTCIYKPRGIQNFKYTYKHIYIHRYKLTIYTYQTNTYPHRLVAKCTEENKNNKNRYNIYIYILSYQDA